MKKNTNRREQNRKPPKGKNTELMHAMQELRRSSATSRHGSPADYRRKPKHVGRGWE